MKSREELIKELTDKNVTFEDTMTDEELSQLLDSKPTEGETPTDTATPAEGDKPTEGETPTDTATPAEGDKPTEGETPTDTATPVVEPSPEAIELKALKGENVKNGALTKLLEQKGIDPALLNRIKQMLGEDIEEWTDTNFADLLKEMPGLSSLQSQDLGAPSNPNESKDVKNNTKTKNI